MPNVLRMRKPDGRVQTCVYRLVVRALHEVSWNLSVGVFFV